MPISKKRKPKKEKRSVLHQPKSDRTVKKKITTKLILFYIISAAMIISMVGSFLVSGSGSGGGVPSSPHNAQPLDLSLPTTEPATTSEPTAEGTSEPATTSEPTAESTSEPTTTSEPTAESTTEGTSEPAVTSEPHTGN